MFRTHMGPVDSEDNLVYLRPETAQGIFINYENVRRALRLKLPFGIAQLGKVFRNEITPGQFVFRTREFEQMEMEYFCRPEESPKWFQYWQEQRMSWYLDLGMTAERLRIRPHEADELSHYSSGTVDVEYLFPWGWDELEGIADRSDFDLRQHSELSGEDLRFFDQDSGERFFPYVVEPAAGATRATFAFLIDAYHEEEVNDETRVVLRLDSRLAPYKVAVLPLSKKAELIEPADKIASELRRRWMTEVDTTQSIGRRYRRQDEIGTPFAVTVDFDSLDDQAVTVRDRDTMAQDRVAMTGLVEYLESRLA
jgi:glycyl-tRNA synthetase